MNPDKRGFWSAAFTLSGTIIGAGILVLPYVFSQAGFLSGAFWLLFLGAIIIFIHLALGEVALRTKKIHQIPGYAEKYLGTFGKYLALAAVLFGVYSALIAYLIGGGESLSVIFTGTLNYSVYFGIASWLSALLLLRNGLEGLRKAELFGVLGIAALVIVIFFAFAPQVSLSNFSQQGYGNFLLPFGVVLFALLGFTAIPELRREVLKKEKMLKKAIIVGTAIPVAMYFLFAFALVGAFGKNISQVATLSLGNLAILLGIFTMYTSYFVLSFVAKDIARFDLKKGKKTQFFFYAVTPLAFYLLIVFYNLADFAKVIAVGGVVSGGITGILILLMNIKAKKHGDRKPEYSIPLNWLLFFIASAIFVLGILSLRA